MRVDLEARHTCGHLERRRVTVRRQDYWLRRIKRTECRSCGRHTHQAKIDMVEKLYQASLINEALLRERGITPDSL